MQYFFHSSGAASGAGDTRLLKSGGNKFSGDNLNSASVGGVSVSGPAVMSASSSQGRVRVPYNKRKKSSRRDSDTRGEVLDIHRWCQASGVDGEHCWGTLWPDGAAWQTGWLTDWVTATCDEQWSGDCDHGIVLKGASQPCYFLWIYNILWSFLKCARELARFIRQPSIPGDTDVEVHNV